VLIAEPDVTLTDFGLAIECGVFAGLLPASGPTARWFRRFFVATALASLLGGVVHGFFPEPTALAGVLWAATLLAIGAAALAAWAAGSYLLVPASSARWIVGAAVVEFVAYATLVVSGADRFAVAIYHYAPAALFLLVALGGLLARTRARPAVLGVAGLVLTFVAAGVQAARIGIHPVLLGHNALYHLIQAVALALLFACARWIARREAC
jgi:hypothetical protein